LSRLVMIGNYPLILQGTLLYMIPRQEL